MVTRRDDAAEVSAVAALESAAQTGLQTGEVEMAVRVIEEAEQVVDSAEAYVTTLEELSGLLLEDASLEQLLTHVLELTSHALVASAAVSVTVVGDDGGYTTVAASSDAAVAVDRLQYDLGEGPCIDSLETGREHLLRDLDDDGEWPGFRARVGAHGFGSVLSLPLLAGSVAVGALNVFAEEVDAFGQDDIELARRIAAPAAATLANARAYRRVARLAEQLQEAIESRAVIEQAKGVLVAQRRCTPDAAFAALKELSQRSNRKVRHIARLVVEHSTTGRPVGDVAGDRPDAAPPVGV